MHLFLSYCKSHIYELHALLAATITFLAMFELKKPIKVRTREIVDAKAKENQKWEKNRRLYYKRCNMLIVAATLLLAALLFLFLSIVSPFINFSWHMTWMSGAFALTEYAIYDQVIGKEKHEYE